MLEQCWDREWKGARNTQHGLLPLILCHWLYSFIFFRSNGSISGIGCGVTCTYTPLYRKLLFYSLLSLSLWCSSKNPVTQWWFWLENEKKFSSPQRKHQVTNSTWCLWMFSQRRTPRFAMVSILGFERNWRGEQSSSWESGWGRVSCHSPSFVFGQAESLPAIESTLISNASVFHHQICVRCNGYSLAFNVSSDVTFSYSSACYGDCQPKNNSIATTT